MPNNPDTPARVRPTLLFWVVATAALALFGVAGSVALIVVDASYVDLPNPMVTFVGIFGATAGVICVILGMAHLLRVASAENTQAGIVAITAARTDLKTDTGEIPNLARLMRDPRVLVVRDPGPFDKPDRDQTMRVTADMERRSDPAGGQRPADEMTADEWRIYMSGYYDRRRREGGEGPDPVA